MQIKVPIGYTRVRLVTYVSPPTPNIDPRIFTRWCKWKRDEMHRRIKKYAAMIADHQIKAFAAAAMIPVSMIKGDLNAYAPGKAGDVLDGNYHWRQPCNP